MVINYEFDFEKVAKFLSKNQNNTLYTKDDCRLRFSELKNQ